MRKDILIIFAIGLFVQPVEASRIKGIFFDLVAANFVIESAVMYPRTDLVKMNPELWAGEYCGTVSGIAVRVREGAVAMKDPDKLEVAVLDMKQQTIGRYRLSAVICKEGDVLIGAVMFERELDGFSAEREPGVYISARGGSATQLADAFESILNNLEIVLVKNQRERVVKNDGLRSFIGELCTNMRSIGEKKTQ